MGNSESKQPISERKQQTIEEKKIRIDEVKIEVKIPVVAETVEVKIEPKKTIEQQHFDKYFGSPEVQAEIKIKTEIIKKACRTVPGGKNRLDFFGLDHKTLQELLSKKLLTMGGSLNTWHVKEMLKNKNLQANGYMGVTEIVLETVYDPWEKLNLY